MRKDKKGIYMLTSEQKKAVFNKVKIEREGHHLRWKSLSTLLIETRELARENLINLTKEYRTLRREQLGNISNYVKLWKDYHKALEFCLEEYRKEAAKVLNISEATWEDTLNHYSYHIDGSIEAFFSKFNESLVIYPAPTKTITMQDMKKVLTYQAKVTEDQLEKLKDSTLCLINPGSLRTILKYNIEDHIFKEFGFEEEDIAVFLREHEELHRMINVVERKEAALKETVENYCSSGKKSFDEENPTNYSHIKVYIAGKYLSLRTIEDINAEIVKAFKQNQERFKEEYKRNRINALGNIEAYVKTKTEIISRLKDFVTQTKNDILKELNIEALWEESYAYYGPRRVEDATDILKSLFEKFFAPEKPDNYISFSEKDVIACLKAQIDFIKEEAQNLKTLKKFTKNDHELVSVIESRLYDYIEKTLHIPNLQKAIILKKIPEGRPQIQRMLYRFRKAVETSMPSLQQQLLEGYPHCDPETQEYFNSVEFAKFFQKIEKEGDHLTEATVKQLDETIFKIEKNSYCNIFRTTRILRRKFSHRQNDIPSYIKVWRNYNDKFQEKIHNLQEEVLADIGVDLNLWRSSKHLSKLHSPELHEQLLSIIKDTEEVPHCCLNKFKEHINTISSHFNLIDQYIEEISRLESDPELVYMILRDKVFDSISLATGLEEENIVALLEIYKGDPEVREFREKCYEICERVKNQLLTSQVTK